MDMIGHERPGMNGRTIAIGAFQKPVGKSREVRVAGKAGLPVIPPLHDMHGEPWRAITPSPRHQDSP